MSGSEHERAKEPLPIRRSQHPHLLSTSAVVGVEPSRSPRPIRPEDSEPGIWRGQGVV